MFKMSALSVPERFCLNTLARGSSVAVWNRMPGVCFRNPWWAIHCYYGDVSRPPSTATSAWSFFWSLILLVPTNSDTSLPKAELRGKTTLLLSLPKKKALYPNSIGPELDEAWERHVPLNSFDKATWASGEHFKHEGSLNTKLAAVALLQWAHLFACVTAP